MAVKIATCSYCGTRAALKLTEVGRHELACSACGAPLHELKQMPVDKPAKPYRKYTEGHAPYGQERRKPKKAKKKSRKRFSYRDAFEDLFDVVEDIFD